MSALAPDIDLKGALRAVGAEGAAFIPRALAPSFGRRLQHEVETGPFAPMPGQIGRVSQEVESYVLRGTDIEAFPLISELLAELAGAVRRAGKGVEGLSSYAPNHLMVHRYRPGSIGITPHLDGKRFVQLVATFTTKGTAKTALCRSRKGEVIREWDTKAGSLILLRGNGFAGRDDGRPFHSIGGPQRQGRYAVVLRMERG